VAVSADGKTWFLLNASPDIRQQIESFPPLHPAAPRHSPITGILLGNGDLDHCLGLLSLREGQSLAVWATDRVRRGFVEGNVLYRTLERFPGQVAWHRLEPGREAVLRRADGAPSGLTVEAHCMPGKPPRHLEALTAPHPEDNVGFRVRDLETGGALVHVSAAATITPLVQEAVRDAGCLFFDGTFWSSGELSQQGVGTARAEEMGHVPISGRGGSLEGFAGLPAGRRIYIHMNNTNPILRAESPERAQVVARGWEVAWDGMELAL
jgi:pyrroloquinoline quinone biosynthesis protein B